MGLDGFMSERERERQMNGFAHRHPQYDGQQKFHIRAKMLQFLNTGHPQYGNLREQHVIGDFVYADSPEHAVQRFDGGNHRSYVWVKVVNEDGNPYGYVDPTTLPEDHPDYCPF